MNEKMIEAAKFAIGLERNKPRKKHGKLFYCPTKNRYFARVENEVWNELTRLGYAVHSEPTKRSGLAVFSLTCKGLDWLGKQLGITIHDEEEHEEEAQNEI